jgi:hypothetical protein
VSEVVYPCNLADGVLHRCLNSSLEQELIIFRILQGQSMVSGIQVSSVVTKTCFKKLFKALAHLEMQQHHAVAEGAKLQISFVRLMGQRCLARKFTRALYRSWPQK